MSKKGGMYVRLRSLSLYQAYFGFIEVSGLQRALRKVHEASGWLTKVLFPTVEDLGKNGKTGETIDIESENRVFDLSEISDWKETDGNSYGRMFKHTDQSLKDLFMDGSKLSEQQCCIVVRAYQVRDWRRENKDRIHIVD